MKKVWITLILVMIVLAGCGIVTFDISIPESEEIILDTKYAGGIPYYFDNVRIDELQKHDSKIKHAEIMQITLDLTFKATFTGVSDVDITVYASTTELQLTDVITHGEELKVFELKIEESNEPVQVTLDSKEIGAFQNIIDHVNQGGRTFYLAAKVKNLGNFIQEISMKLNGGNLSFKLK
ncbi:MAG: hypothetical protein FXF54_10720 [Kosmotoga sp.]|nr:MAG: hypothetical protein FXF54_10720 [Kosmotoga sp.]